MPHQCVRCGTFFEDGAKEILEGCSCGGKLFFFIKKEKLEQAKKTEELAKLTEEEKVEIEKDVMDLIGTDIDKNKPVILDFEAVRVIKPGKYEIDLISLFRKQPLIFRIEDGKYFIDIKQSFKKSKKKD
jgi:uncharacterized protein